MFKLLFSVFALTMVSGKLEADSLAAELPLEFVSTDRAPADEPEPEDELLMSEDLPGVEGVGLNGTGLQRANLAAEKYGVYLERVDLTKCQHYKNYLPYFYGGLVVNSRGWMTKKGQERFTSMAILKTDGSVVSSTSGAWPPKTQLVYHTWEMIHFGTSFQDIRTTNPGTLNIQAWNAGQQIYIPIHMADLAGGRAYMLHIYPQPSFLANPDAYSYDNGLLWAKGDTNRLYKFDIDVAGLIKNLDNFSVPSYRNFIKPYGVVKTNSSGYQSAVAYSDVRHIDVQGLTQGSATDYICRDSLNTMDMTWTQMKSIINRELTWL